jgi:two-component system sensor histidine kinase/response regulator
MNVLIAEDHPAIQLFNSRLMQAWGFECDLVYDGAEAVSLARKNEGLYDLCVMDIEMPRMNGIEAIRAIRENLSYLPILAITSDRQYRDRCLAAGADAFVVKPCSPATFLAKIQQLVPRVVAGAEGFSASERMLKKMPQM